MKPLDTCLTLIVPVSLEEPLTDLLLEHGEWVSSFAAQRVEVHGPSIALSGSAEEVSGHSLRVEMRLVLNREDARALLAALHAALPNREVFYWLSPVLEFGRIA